jgi:sulfatase maturation enzyme AslB (radical SAM superfamily)
MDVTGDVGTEDLQVSLPAVVVQIPYEFHESLYKSTRANTVRDTSRENVKVPLACFLVPYECVRFCDWRECGIRFVGR